MMIQFRRQHYTAPGALPGVCAAPARHPRHPAPNYAAAIPAGAGIRTLWGANHPPVCGLMCLAELRPAAERRLTRRPKPTEPDLRFEAIDEQFPEHQGRVIVPGRPRPDGARHGVSCGQKRAGVGVVPDPAAGRVPRGALQGAEYVQQLLCHPRRRRNRPRPGRPGRSRRRGRPRGK